MCVLQTVAIHLFKALPVLSLLPPSHSRALIPTRTTAETTNPILKTTLLTTTTTAMVTAVTAKAVQLLDKTRLLPGTRIRLRDQL